MGALRNRVAEGHKGTRDHLKLQGEVADKNVADDHNHQWCLPSGHYPPQYLLLNARWEMAHKRPALALKSIAKKVKEETPPKKEVLEMRVKALQELGWTHWASKQRSEILDRFPESYPLF